MPDKIINNNRVMKAILAFYVHGVMSAEEKRRES
jgi:hypothetical protein